MTGESKRVPSIGGSRRTDIPDRDLGHSRTHKMNPNTSKSSGLKSQDDRRSLGLRDVTFVVVDEGVKKDKSENTEKTEE